MIKKQNYITTSIQCTGKSLFHKFVSVSIFNENETSNACVDAIKEENSKTEIMGS